MTLVSALLYLRRKVAPVSSVSTIDFRFRCVAAWPVDDARLADLSDLALDARRRPWVLSDQSRSLGRIETGADGAVSVVDLVQLPKGVEKPEGLAFLPDGSALVASDLPGEADNLVRVRLPLP